MAIAKKSFTMTSATGTFMFEEGQHVSDEIAKMFPMFMVGSVESEEVKHDPTLPEKLTKAQAEKMSDAKLLAWVKQFRKGSVPSAKLERQAMIELVLSLQE